MFVAGFVDCLKVHAFPTRVREIVQRPLLTRQSRDFCSYYRGADKSLTRPTSRCILFDGENIPFDASLVIYIYK